MKLFLFKQDTAYGEFIEIVSANSEEEAWSISKAYVLGWSKDCQELTTTNNPCTIFEGGGSNG